MVVQLWRRLQTLGLQWAESSYSLSIVRQLVATESTASSTRESINEHETTETATTMESPEAEPLESTPSEASSPSKPPVGIETPETPTSSVYENALSYRLSTGIRELVDSSWLYRWLTAEPDAEVVVIDLRETLSAGPILASIDQTVRNAIEVMPTSSGLRRGYRLRQRFRAHPIRIVSIGALGVILIGFVGVVATGGPIGVATFVLILGLILSARGTQNKTPLSEVTDAEWFQLLVETFESPAPPETRTADTTQESTESAGEDDDRYSS